MSATVATRGAIRPSRAAMSVGLRGIAVERGEERIEGLFQLRRGDGVRSQLVGEFLKGFTREVQSVPDPDT